MYDAALGIVTHLYRFMGGCIEERIRGCMCRCA